MFALRRARVRSRKAHDEMDVASAAEWRTVQTNRETADYVLSCNCDAHASLKFNYDVLPASFRESGNESGNERARQ